jgi:predicted 3-demethylubiquinone-9 3-methyltransferase (glyoxalase superfamily)
MQKIIPFLWFEKNMKEITDFYLSVFPGSTCTGGGKLDDTPSGVATMATLTLFGIEFSLMTAGPYLPFNPTISCMITCDTTEEVDYYWNKLSESGKILMPLQAYSFAEKYAWVMDRYGVSWQIMFSTTVKKSAQKIIPTMLFAGDVCGRAEEAVNFYTEVFHNSKIAYITKYGPEDAGEKTEPRAVVKHAGFSLEGFDMALMDSGRPGQLNFQQAISFMVNCETQDEVDYYWQKLTENGGTEIQCGWLNDKFGVPWQIVPTAMGRMMSTGTKEQIARVTAAFMKMKKFNIAELEAAFLG